MLASFTKMPHWELSDDEEKKLGQAIKLSAKHLDIRATERVSDYLAIAGLLGEIYVPRVVMTVQELKERKAPAQRGRPAQPIGNGLAPAIDIGLGVREDDTASLGELVTGDPDSPVRIN